MAESSDALLSLTETAIAGLLTAMATPAVQEYSIGTRRVARADFPLMLRELRQTRKELIAENSRQNRSPVRLGKIGLPSRTSR